MHFVWDKVKERENKRKQGVSFELAKQIFDDPYVLSWLDKRFNDYQEER